LVEDVVALGVGKFTVAALGCRLISGHDPPLFSEGSPPGRAQPTVKLDGVDAERFGRIRSPAKLNITFVVAYCPI
jgi:hypothetical protein